MRIAITGVNGFIGRRLSSFLEDEGHQIKKISWEEIIGFYKEENIDKINWSKLLKGIDLIIHCASKVHCNDTKDPNAKNEYDLINIKSFEDLINNAIKNNIRRIIFLSTIKVYGEFVRRSHPINKFTKLDSKDIYSFSKIKSEENLINICKKSSLKFTVLRLPLVYGTNVKANFLKLINFIYLNKFPLPVGLVDNKRSILYLENLMYFIKECLENSKTENLIIPVADSKPISLRLLIKLISNGLNKKTIIFAFPTFIIKIALFITGKRNISKSTLSSLYFSPEYLYSEICWDPPFSTRSGIEKTCEWFLKNKSYD